MTQLCLFSVTIGAVQIDSGSQLIDANCQFIPVSDSNDAIGFEIAVGVLRDFDLEGCVIDP
ncbi:hypothetical protein, partial [Hyphomicrobium sp.]|uniref:hypothetical protein n=1 Tax=Hyphomicrobium sp. TaxID=82 RepID=UPI0035652418